jgi:hypothetical protein
LAENFTGTCLANGGGMRLALHRIQIKEPCNESWDQMPGTELSRFCGKCETRVHNLSAMTESEVAALLEKNPEGFCGRYKAATDGVPLFRAIERRRFLRKALWLVSGFIPALALACRKDRDEDRESSGPEKMGNIPPPQNFMGLM